MKYLKVMVLGAMVSIFSNCKKASDSSVTPTTSVTGQKLVWADEFNIDGAPDPTKWGYDIGNGVWGWGNNELEYYTNRTDNVIISNGTLKIIAKKENYSGFGYTSARIKTENLFSFKYGRVEIRAKLPCGVGVWPALWMIGTDYATNTWPACGEMDIMEQKGSDENRIYGTLHYPNHSGANGDGANTLIANATTQFHVYTLDWNATSINISVDGTVYKTVANSSAIPFNHNFFIILNLAMGGLFTGPVDANFTTSTLEIDYIRVYQ